MTALLAIVRSSTPTGVIAALASAATTGGWVLTRYAVFTKAVLPTDLSPSLDRAGTALALGHRHRRRGPGGPIRRVVRCPRLEPVAAGSRPGRYSQPARLRVR